MEAQRPVQALPDEVVTKLRSSLTIPSIADCVEELVLNSLDANATCIAVRVDLESLRVQVVDNGCGIPEGSLEAIGRRYSTSKCYQIEDLGNLAFFGFRGEFLSSLSKVSSVLEVITKPYPENQTFTKLFRKGKLHEMGEAKEMRPAHGTTVNAYNIYYNLPVRQKKISVVLDLDRIRKCLVALAISHPQISFSLRDDCTGSKIIQTHSTKSAKSAFGFLFGHTKSNILREVSHTHKTFTIRGYVGIECHTNKSLQFVYVNKRPVHKTKVHKAVNKYLRHSLLLKSQRHGNESESPVQNEFLSITDETSPKKAQGEYAVFILDITCLRCEYDIIPDPSQTFLEFQDWPGLTNCLEKALHKFLVKERLVLSISETIESIEEVGKPLDEDSEDDELIEPVRRSSPVSPTNLRKLQHFGYNITTTGLSNNLQSRIVTRAHLTAETHSKDTDSSISDDTGNEDESMKEPDATMAGPCDENLSGDVPPGCVESLQESTGSCAINLWSSEEEGCHISDTKSGLVSQHNMKLIISETQDGQSMDKKFVDKICQSSHDSMVTTVKETQTLGDSCNTEPLIPGILSSSVDIASDKFESLSDMLPSCASTIRLQPQTNSESMEIGVSGPVDNSETIMEHPIKEENCPTMTNESMDPIVTPSSCRVRTPVKCGPDMLECGVDTSPSTNQSAGTWKGDNLLSDLPSKTMDFVTPVTLTTVIEDGTIDSSSANLQGHRENTEGGTNSVVGKMCNNVVECGLSDNAAMRDDTAKQSDIKCNCKHHCDRDCPTKPDGRNYISSLQRFRDGLKCCPSNCSLSGPVHPPKMSGEPPSIAPRKTSTLSELRSHWFPDVGLRMSREKGKCVVSSNSKLLLCLSQKLAFLRTRQDQCSHAESDVGSGDVNPSQNKEHMEKEDVCYKTSIGCQTSPLPDGRTRGKDKVDLDVDTREFQPRTPEIRVIKQNALSDMGQEKKDDLCREVSDNVSRHIEGNAVPGSSREMDISDVCQKLSSNIPSERIHTPELRGLERGYPYPSIDRGCGSKRVHNVTNKNEDARSRSSFLSSASFVQSAKEVLLPKNCHSHPRGDGMYTSCSNDGDLKQGRSSRDNNIPVEISTTLADSSRNRKENSDDRIAQDAKGTCSQASIDSTRRSSMNPGELSNQFQEGFRYYPNNHRNLYLEKQGNEIPPVSNEILRDEKHQALLSLIDTAFCPVNDAFLMDSGQPESIPFSDYQDFDINELGSTQPFSVPKKVVSMQHINDDQGTQPFRSDVRWGSDSCKTDKHHPMEMPSLHPSLSDVQQAEPAGNFGPHLETETMAKTRTMNMSDGSSSSVEGVASSSVEFLGTQDSVSQGKQAVSTSLGDVPDDQEGSISFASFDSQLSQRTLDVLARLDEEELQTLTAGEQAGSIPSRLETQKEKGHVTSCRVQGELNMCNLLGSSREAESKESASSSYQLSQGTLTALRTMNEEELGNLTVIEVPVKVTNGSASRSDAQKHGHEEPFINRQRDEEDCDRTRVILTKDHQIALQKAPSSLKTNNLHSITSLDIGLEGIDKGAKKCNRKTVTFKIPIGPDTPTTAAASERRGSLGGNTSKKGPSKTLPWELFWFLPKAAKDFFPCKSRESQPDGNEDEAESGTAQLIDQHLIETDQGEATVKWKGGLPLEAGGSLRSVDDLFNNWQNPVFKAGDREVLNATQALSATVKVHNRLHPYHFTKKIFNSLQIIGQLDNKFVACLVNTSSTEPVGIHAPHLLVLVDQHAAHERVRLEQLTQEAYRSSVEGASQLDDSDDDDQECRCLRSTPILPVPIHISDHECRLAQAYSDKLARFGISVNIEKMDRAYRADVTALPTCLAERETNSGKKAKQSCSSDLAETLVQECVHLIQETGGSCHVLPKTIIKSLNSQACRGAIKFGDDLDHDNMVLLLSQLSECNLPFQCAHGRPSIIPLLDLDHLNQKLNPQNAEDLCTKPNLSRLSKKISADHLKQR